MNKENRKRIILLFGSIIVIAVFSLFVAIPYMHTFLSVNKPVHATALVVSGWHWEFVTMIDQAVTEFKNNEYLYVILTGETVDIERAESLFVERGISSDKIKHAPRINHSGLHNTFQEAEGLRKYLLATAPEIHAVNVVAGSMHARKTFVLFKRVLGKSVNVGIFAFPTGYYNEKKVWTSPNAIWWTIKYFIGYIYALFWKLPVDLNG